MPNTTTNSGVAKSAAKDANILMEDMVALKGDATNLVKDIKSNGSAVARESIEQLRNAGETRLQSIGEYAKENPARSLLAAFAAGIFASALFGGRR